ncbi:aquaporin-like protein [Cercophora scortea]|uniref:Aquaporin-like protein n=1 Tax=Cercophora scortea TaxID=314031 RepID=A0AAE0INL0_9PEZI|nr:aquaporin-like protein [Cercophora scortea]
MADTTKNTMLRSPTYGTEEDTPTGPRGHTTAPVDVSSFPNIDGAFEGSFAATARDRPEASPTPWYYRREYYTGGWTDRTIWRSLVVECVATTCQIYIGGQFGMTLMESGTTQITAYVGIFNTFLLATFIYATATATGGHLNPMITFATVLCGLTPVSRGTFLMTAQITGGILAGGLLLGTWGHDRAVSHLGGGNFFDPSIISPGQVLLNEIMSCATLLVLAIGTGLDPRQQILYGRQLGPLLVGLSVGVVSCASTRIAPGYTGASMNPARAIALAIASSHWENQWVWWVGPALGSILVALMYRLAPPSHFQGQAGSKAQLSVA